MLPLKLEGFFVELLLKRPNLRGLLRVSFITNLPTRSRRCYRFEARSSSYYYCYGHTNRICIRPSQSYELYMYSSFPTHRTFILLSEVRVIPKQDRYSRRITMHVVTSDSHVHSHYVTYSACSITKIRTDTRLVLIPIYAMVRVVQISREVLVYNLY